MSLFSSIRLAANTLRANEIALQVVGQNIANANTPGYIREDVILVPGPTQRRGSLLLGMGVNVEAVVQKIDRFLEERLRGSVSDRVDAETRESSYLQLEAVIGELGDTDLSTALNTFFSSIDEILNQPENASVRNLAVLQGEADMTEGTTRRLEANVHGADGDLAEDHLTAPQRLCRDQAARDQEACAAARRRALELEAEVEAAALSRAEQRDLEAPQVQATLKRHTLRAL